MDTADAYADRWITCTAAGVEVRGYYFPWGTKRIPYSAIRGVRRVDLTAARGRARIWGTANPGYWASLDPRRPKKSTALVFDLGARVKPFLTPDDPDAVEAIVRERSGLGPATDDGSGGTGPLI
ncbi:MAG: hypothetical protein ABSF84_06135 [Acidimicrobiales bacterium]|jgi:hypothetical protein